MNNYRIFSRKAYRRDLRTGQYVPHASRGRTIGYAETIEQAREMCASGPANVALREGREYRHLAFHEFTSI